MKTSQSKCTVLSLIIVITDTSDIKSNKTTKLQQILFSPCYPYMSGRNISGSEELAIGENRRNQLWEAIHDSMNQIEEYNNTIRAIHTRMSKVEEIVADGRARIQRSERKCEMIRKILGLQDERLDVHEEIERIRNCLKNLNLKNPEDKKKLKAVVPLVRSMRYRRPSPSPDGTGHQPSPAD